MDAGAQLCKIRVLSMLKIKVINNLKAWPDTIQQKHRKNAKQMGNELLSMRRWVEEQVRAGRELQSGTSRLESALLLCQIRTPFWASKTPAAAVSPVIKMPLSLLSLSDFNYKYL